MANQVGKSIVSTMVIPLLLTSLLGVEPAAAKSIVQSVVTPDRAALDSMRTQQLRVLPKWLRKIYRISRKFLSGSVKGSNGASGDNVMLPALVRSTLIITVGIVLATVMLRWEDFSQTRRLKKEIHREMKYREDMFIDAVSDLIKKIEDPKVKPAIKEDLKKELRDLDTKGEIQAFVKGRGPRPDLSTRITESMRKKTDEKEKAIASARAKQEQQRQREQQALNARLKAEEEEQARERKRLKLEADILRKQQPTDQSAGAARQRGSSSSAASAAAAAAAAAVPPNKANQRPAAVDFHDDHSHQRRTAAHQSDDNEDDDDDNYLDEDEEDDDEDEDREEDEEGPDREAVVAADAASTQVLARLNSVLMQFNQEQGREVVSSRARQLLLDEFARRLQQVDDVGRRQEILQRIEQRLDNVPYWVEYSQRLVEEDEGDEDYYDDEEEEEDDGANDDSDGDETNV
eukprot:gene12924-9244_t